MHPCRMCKTELCFSSTVLIFCTVTESNSIVTMTHSHPKLPITSFFSWLFGKSRRTHFLGLVLLFAHMPWPEQCLVAQTQPSAKLAIGHDFWGFKEGAPPGPTTIAQSKPTPKGRPLYCVIDGRSIVEAYTKRRSPPEFSNSPSTASVASFATAAEWLSTNP